MATLRELMAVRFDGYPPTHINCRSELAPGSLMGHAIMEVGQTLCGIQTVDMMGYDGGKKITCHACKNALADREIRKIAAGV